MARAKDDTRYSVQVLIDQKTRLPPLLKVFFWADLRAIDLAGASDGISVPCIAAVAFFGVIVMPLALPEPVNCLRPLARVIVPDFMPFMVLSYLKSISSSAPSVARRRNDRLSD